MRLRCTSPQCLQRMASPGCRSSVFTFTPSPFSTLLQPNARNGLIMVLGLIRDRALERTRGYVRGVREQPADCEAARRTSEAPLPPRNRAVVDNPDASLNESPHSVQITYKLVSVGRRESERAHRDNDIEILRVTDVEWVSATIVYRPRCVACPPPLESTVKFGNSPFSISSNSYRRSAVLSDPHVEIPILRMPDHDTNVELWEP